MKRSNGYFSSDGLVSAPEKNLSIEEKRAMCTEFFNDLCNELKDTHTLVKSCNKDYSAYLVPKGTEDQISYSSKPVGSYRISDHWNWYANIKKCPDENYVQCLNVDMPRAKSRPEEGKPSKPIFGICVAFFGADHKYHHVFGEKFDRRIKRWVFCESDKLRLYKLFGDTTIFTDPFYGAD